MPPGMRAGMGDSGGKCSLWGSAPLILLGFSLKPVAPQPPLHSLCLHPLPHPHLHLSPGPKNLIPYFLFCFVAAFDTRKFLNDFCIVSLL